VNRAECQKLIDAYVGWLRQGLSVEDVGEACELTTPFLDRHNDHLQVYAIRRNGNIILSDDGYILSDLRTSGLEVDTPKRKMVLDSVLNGLGVRAEGGQLLVEASAANLGQRLHSLVQAMLAVNDMFVMAQHRVASFFFEDVRNFLDSNDVRYTPRVKLAGKSGYDHGIDFLIPKSRATRANPAGNRRSKERQYCRVSLDSERHAGRPGGRIGGRGLRILERSGANGRR